MNFIFKMISFVLSCVFTLSTFTGVFPLTIPSRVFLSEISEQDYSLSTENFGFKYDEGKFSLSFNGVTIFTDAISEFKIKDEVYNSADFEMSGIETISVSDKRGDGIKLVATLLKDNLILKQNFTFYNSESYFLVSCDISTNDGDAQTNYIAPVVINDGKIQNSNPRWTNFLEVPFDNDGWVEFTTKNLCQSGLSHEVGAFFTPDNKDGFILGSVTHDLWKSAVEYENKLSKIEKLKAYSGANTVLTRDQSPHGTVSGKEVSSAVFFLGFYDNWKDGMNEYARVNTTFAPKRTAVINSNPIGWNSWGSIQSDINYSQAIATSDYIKDNLQDVWQAEEDTVFVNLDSYWDNMSADELKAFVEHCENNGQKAGIYYSPFVSWWDEYGMQTNYVPGTDVTFNDIRLKKADGSYYGNDIDGCFPLDVTHPVTINYFKNRLSELMSYGFKYIKLDFLVHGSLEGLHYNPDIQTGIEAYNFAMKQVCETIGDDVFINLAMSPIFPYNYANGRRLSCDSYYKIGDTQYTLNALTYGFWQSELYDYIDPDHLVVWGKDGKASENEAKSRLVSGVVSSGSFLLGDNFVEPYGNRDKAFERYNSLLKNSKLTDILKKGKPFVSKLDISCPYAADVFTLEHEGKLYLAVFNYSLAPKTMTVHDLPEGAIATDIFSGKQRKFTNGSMTIMLSPKESTIFEIG